MDRKKDKAVKAIAEPTPTTTEDTEEAVDQTRESGLWNRSSQLKEDEKADDKAIPRSSTESNAGTQSQNQSYAQLQESAKKPQEVELAKVEKDEDGTEKDDSFKKMLEREYTEAGTRTRHSSSSSNRFPSLQSHVAKQQKALLSQTGATLHWRNISYQKGEEIVLFPASGYLQSGEMLGVMGGPNSGVKELLEILTKRAKPTQESQIYAPGNLLLNRLPPGKFFKRTVAYIPSTDNHLPHLTVEETLEFSARMRCPAHADDKDIKLQVKLALDWLGLSGAHGCEKTIVGNSTIKGISGGQKRRLSIGVEVVSGYSILIANLPTNGLDAKTAFDVVESVKRICGAGKSALLNVASPSPSLLKLFDNILILAKGETLYFGPTEKMEQYFLDEGFERPESKSLSTWIEDLLQKPKLYYKFGQDGHTNESLWREMIAYWKKSLEKEIVDRIVNDAFNWDQPVEDINADPVVQLGRKLSWSSYHERTMAKTVDFRGRPFGMNWVLPVLPGFVAQVKELCRREYKSVSRNKPMIMSRLLQVVVVGSSLLMLFFQMKEEQVRVRVALIFFCVGFMGFGAVPFIPGTVVQDRPVFYQQVAANYYTPHAWYCSKWICESLLSMIEALIFATITYWGTGLDPSINYISFLLFLWSIRFNSWAFCQAAAALFPTSSSAQAFATMILPICFAFNGFLVPISKESTLLSRALNFFSFFTHIFRALVGQEFNGLVKKLGDGNWLCYYRDDENNKESAFHTLWYTGLDLTKPDLMNEDKKLLTKLRLGWVAKGYCNNGFKIDNEEGINGIFHNQLTTLTAFVFAILWNLAFNLLAYNLFRYINHDKETEEGTQSAPIASKWPEEKVKKAKEDSDVDLDQKINGVYIEFSNVNLYKPNPYGLVEYHVLKNVNGYVRPGDLVALMGPSGAGKTSLLDVLADKTNDGRITGEILINGKKRNRYFRRIAGYVEQFNSHMDCLTVREALTFAADLRMNSSKNDADDRTNAVEDILHKLEIAHLGNERIGNDISGISMEAKKKLTIAVELVGRPGLLFLDEPTTGLDSSAAINVMRIVRALAHQGQAVICTVHQPPREAYSYFDRILLLQAGGTTAYFGDCDKLNSYLDRAGAGEMKPGKNPADWAIEAIAAFETHETWLKSKEMLELVDTIEETVCPKDHIAEKITSTHATSICRQWQILFFRSIRFFWRDSLNLWMRFISALVISLSFGTL